MRWLRELGAAPNATECQRRDFPVLDDQKSDRQEHDRDHERTDA
jgi:hypothetical protein